MSSKKPHALKTSSDLEALDYARLVDTVELRRTLVREARSLTRTAVKQAKRGKPALLRLLVRLAMRPTFPDRRRTN